MGYKFRITSTWNKGNRYFPVGAFFNAFPDEAFLDVMNYFVSGIGSGFNDVECEFPDENDPWEEAFEGMRFTAIKETVVVSYREAYHYMDLACKAYIEDHPEDREKVEALKKQFYDKYCKDAEP